MDKKTKQLNYQNNKLDNQINPENQEAYTDMICYLRGSSISEYDQEMVRQDLLEMILSAQGRNENIKSVIGEDYKSFCDKVISNLPPKSIKQKIIDSFDLICWCLSILLTINIVLTDETATLIHNLATGKPLYFNISFSVGNLISIVLILILAVIMVEVIAKNSFKIGKNKHHNRTMGCFIGAGIITIFLLTAWLGKQTLFTINIFIPCIFALILYVTHKILERI